MLPFRPPPSTRRAQHYIFPSASELRRFLSVFGLPALIRKDHAPSSRSALAYQPCRSQTASGILCTVLRGASSSHL